MNNPKNRPEFEDSLSADIDRIDALLDEALRENFPDSDPVAVNAPKQAAVKSVAIQAGASTIYGGESALVDQLLPTAYERLVTIAGDAPLLEVARLLRAGTDLVVVCGYAGTVMGVITKTDVVARIGECLGAACTTAAALVMSVDVVQCTLGDRLQDVWLKMQSRGLKNVLVVGADGCPLGVINARDILGVLLREVKGDESLLRDYVMGVGYH